MSNNNYVTNMVSWKGENYLYTWIPTNTIESIGQVQLVECVCFNDQRQILIMHEYGNWRIPGGSSRPKESFEEAIQRELKEEVNIEIEKPEVIGLMKVEPQSSPEGVFHNIVYSAKIEKILPRAIDPESGIIHKYIFVDPREVTNYVQWGATGAAMFTHAVK